jgi:hypothetical protein
MVNGSETEDNGDLNRLNLAGLNQKTPSVRSDLFYALFDIGPLFPASAMIVRTEHLLKNTNINSDFDLAGDLAHSMAIARDAHVVFDGNDFVMNYHIHGGNSVFSVKAAGGLMSDFSIVRLDNAVKNDIEMNATRLAMLSRAILVSRILSKAFHLDARYNNVRKYTHAFNKHYGKQRIHWLWLMPIPLGPLKIIVRRLMWKRLGVNRWGY